MTSWDRRADRPLVIAHRGASSERPENSMAAFRRAVEVGADGVELDVRPSATGDAMVFHDADLRRMCGQPAAVEELSRSALARMRVAGSEPIPELGEVFEELAPTEMVVNIEIKTGRGSRVRAVEAAARALARAPAGFDAVDRVVVSSFDPVALALFRRRAARVRIGLLFHGQLVRPLREAWAARGLGVFSVHPERRLVREPAVARWRAAGYRIATWTVDKERDWDRFRGMVDALITNDPAAAVAFYRR